MFDLLWSPVGMLIVGIVLGVIFDEFFTTKFAWLRKEGREAIADVVKRMKARL
ncbi:MAG: hypothetical protein KAI73_10635 [Rhodospirillaceae bacterium]|nr:hypothetical protein [Rhodospirillaceae bacterium]